MRRASAPSSRAPKRGCAGTPSRWGRCRRLPRVSPHPRRALRPPADAGGGGGGGGGKGGEGGLGNGGVAGVSDRVEVRDGDARDLPFDDEAFDVALSNFVILATPALP